MRPAVLLVPGWKDDHAVLRPLAECLIAHGWERSSVVAISFDDPFGSSIAHAAELENAVEQLAAVAKGDIAVIAHSMGGLALRWYLGHSPHPRVRTAISLATPHAGTWVAWLGWGQGAREMRPQSNFLADVSRLRIPQHVRFISMRAPLDTRIFPGTSAWLNGTEQHTVPGRGHRRILAQKTVCDHIAQMLLNTEAENAT